MVVQRATRLLLDYATFQGYVLLLGQGLETMSIQSYTFTLFERV